MTAAEVLAELEPLGSASYRKVLLNHGVKPPVLGVKIQELKRIQKRVKGDHQLAMDLYATGIYDAMYLAGLIADGTRMTKKDLRQWLKQASSGTLVEYTVASLASESPAGQQLALEWIDSKEEVKGVAGWATLSSLVSVKADSELDVGQLRQLLQRVEKTIHQQPDRVRYVMNGFVIAVGCYVRELTRAALQAARKIGLVEADMGATACEVPNAADYIRKVQARGTVGKKRKSARC